MERIARRLSMSSPTSLKKVIQRKFKEYKSTLANLTHIIQQLNETIEKLKQEEQFMRQLYQQENTKVVKLHQILLCSACKAKTLNTPDGHCVEYCHPCSQKLYHILHEEDEGNPDDPQTKHGATHEHVQGTNHE